MNYNYYQDANYGGAPGLPYGAAPPAGFNVPNMPPTNNTPYPQQNYAPYPTSNSGPYMPQNYAPYPPQNSGPYPPQNTGSYPPPSSGSYQSQNNGPYSPPNASSGPYPPSNHAQYPQNGGSYPPQNSGPYAPQNHGQFPPHGPGAGAYGGGGAAPSAPPMEQPVHQSQSFHTPTPASGALPAPARPPPPAGATGGMYPTLPSAAHPGAPAAVTVVTPMRQTQGTVLPLVGFNAESDCAALRKAMKGLGTDERAIIDILCKRSNAQRQELKKLYKTMYGRDLPHDLKSELSGKFEGVILGLMLTPAEYDAKHIHDAMKGAGTDDDTLIEILCTRSNAELELIKTTYKTLYKCDMEKDLKSDTSGDFMRLVVALSAGGRLESQPVNVQRAKEDAAALYKAGKARIGTDEATFTKIFSLLSHAQLCATFDEYRATAGCSIEQTLDSELSGNFCKGLHTIAKVARSKPGYFAERLYHSMKGVGTNDRVLMRVVVTRCEVDMVQIKQEFQTKYHKTLDSFIDGDTSGDYKKTLLALVR